MKTPVCRVAGSGLSALSFHWQDGSFTMPVLPSGCVLLHLLIDSLLSHLYMYSMALDQLSTVCAAKSLEVPMILVQLRPQLTTHFNPGWVAHDPYTHGSVAACSSVSHFTKSVFIWSWRKIKQIYPSMKSWQGSRNTCMVKKHMVIRIIWQNCRGKDSQDVEDYFAWDSF